MDSKTLIERVISGESPSIALDGVYEAEEPKTAQELTTALESAIRKHFPNSNTKVLFRSSLGHPSITIWFTVAANKEELINGISHNDISYTIIAIYGMDKDGNLENTLSFEPNLGGTIHVLPEAGSYNVLGSLKVGLTKKKGTPSQIVNHVDKYFAKLKQTIKANLDKIPKSTIDLIKHHI